MSEQTAIKLEGVGKMYKLFSSPLDAMLETMQLQWLRFRKPVQFTEFWALRDIDLTIPKGSRVGIIGRNGAGKTTMLKLISGNFAPTEGTVKVVGQIQALMDVGAGFHPEFTGYENIQATLIYQNLSNEEMQAAIEDIETFTELGQFLNQPFKTYSAGMKARLSFAAATVIKPEILIVDEILGAGDGYFISKSSERMQQLVVDSGATVLVVTHALDQILRFCDKVIWLERGRIVQQGPALEVIDAYQQYLNILVERQLKARNHGRLVNKQEDQLDFSRDTLVLTLQLSSNNQATCDVSEITLKEYGTNYATLRIGDAQDTNAQLETYLLVNNNSMWSRPEKDNEYHFRSLKVNETTDAQGRVVFNLPGLIEEIDYTFGLTYRCSADAQLILDIQKDGQPYKQYALPTDKSEWYSHTVNFKVPAGLTKETTDQANSSFAASIPSLARVARHWPSEGSISIKNVKLLGIDGQEQFVYRAGFPMTVQITIQAHKSGIFKIRPALTLFRLDGIMVSNLPAPQVTSRTLTTGEIDHFYLDFASLNLGVGRYIFSVSLFQDAITKEQRYDLIGRAFEFEVEADESDLTRQGTIFCLPSNWRHLSGDNTSPSN